MAGDSAVLLAELVAIKGVVTHANMRLGDIVRQMERKAVREKMMQHTEICTTTVETIDRLIERAVALRQFYES